MASAIRVPDLGTTVDEIEIVAWMIEEGEPVQRGDGLVEVETDKALIEVEAAVEGVLLKQMALAGEMVRTDDIIAYVGEAGETVPDEERDVEDRERVPTPPASPGRRPADRPHVSPVVRNLAQKEGVDLATVQGTGQGGVITRQDVLRGKKTGTAEATVSGGERLSCSQGVVAKAVLKSWHEIPHLYITAAVDMAACGQIREQSAMAGAAVSYDTLFLKAMAGAIRSVPLVAARLDGERVIRPEGVHIAIAIGRENDLFLPVIRDVDRKDLPKLQDEMVALAAQARANAFRAEHMTGGCIALTNLGMYPIEDFDPIIFPEHSAILAVGAVQKKPVVLDDRIEVRPMCLVKLAVDHRLINGRIAAQFVCKVKEILESGMLGS